MTLPEDSTVEYDEIETSTEEEEQTATTTTLVSNDGAAVEEPSFRSIVGDHSCRDNREDEEKSRKVWRQIPKQNPENKQQQQQQQRQQQKQQRTRKQGQILQHQSINSFSHGDLRVIKNNNNKNHSNPHLNNHRRSSTENLHLSKKKLLATHIHHRSNNNSTHQLTTNNGRRSSLPSNIIIGNNTRSLPASPLMSPRLITRRVQDQQIISPAFIPCPPSSDSPGATKENKLSPRRSSSVGLIPIENKKNNINSSSNNNNNNNEQLDSEYNNELYCAEDEEIRILNLSPSQSPTPLEGGKFLPNYNNNQQRLKDDFLLKYALRRTQRYVSPF